MLEILEFFKANKGFDRILNAMYDVFVQYDRVFGAVRLKEPAPDEENALSEFFRRDYFDQALIRIGLADFERQIQKNFEDSSVSLGDILQAYLGKPIKQRRAASRSRDSFSTAVSALKFEGTPAEIWLRDLSAYTRRSYRAYSEQFETDPQTVLDTIKSVAETLNDLPEKPTPLAVFANESFGSPTALDFHETFGALFLRALASRFKVPVPTSFEDCISLHMKANLISCGMISTVLVSGLSDDDCRSYTLENLTQMKKFSPRTEKIFVLEDPQIFAAVLPQLKNKKFTLVCPSNGHNAAFLYLLKLFGKTLVFYAGNMTFKGLELADKLSFECQNFVPWRYGVEDFEKIIANGSVILGDDKKNLSMHNEIFAAMLSLLRKTGRTASSMPLVSLYAEDIKNSVQ
ncbi:MAG: TIGR02679 domain-containing protein [Defluviitaleaceae bacterium]|nr:TIGR02679 domain-containing protein [Defluviitaleaceae bacterium]